MLGEIKTHHTSLSKQAFTNNRETYLAATTAARHHIGTTDITYVSTDADTTCLEHVITVTTPSTTYEIIVSRQASRDLENIFSLETITTIHTSDGDSLQFELHEAHHGTDTALHIMHRGRLTTNAQTPEDFMHRKARIANILADVLDIIFND